MKFYHEKPEILYEDSHLIIVNKEAEELTVPGRGADKQNCLMSRTAHFFDKVYNVHRLDQPTSGLVLIALTKEMQSSLSKLFLKREIEKEYIAIVDGVVQGEEGLLDFPIRADITNRPVQIVDPVSGKIAVTRWNVIERYENSTRLLLKSETGRTHQLRVHLQAIGHPICGDRLYNENYPDDLLGELKLHAGFLRFIHPVTGVIVQVKKEPRF